MSNYKLIQGDCIEEMNKLIDKGIKIDMVDIMNNKRFDCPKCNSKDYEIERRFIQEKRLNEYSFLCLSCGYKITSLGNLQKINRECRLKKK